MAEEKRSFSVVACVAKDGAWAAAWVVNGDLFVYRAKGASFPLPHGVERKFRLVVSSHEAPWTLVMYIMRSIILLFVWYSRI